MPCGISKKAYGIYDVMQHLEVFLVTDGFDTLLNDIKFVNIFELDPI